MSAAGLRGALGAAAAMLVLARGGGAAEVPIAPAAPEVAAASAAPSPAAATSSCVACHGSPDLFDEAGREPALRFRDDVHAAVGLSCDACHGGNPDPALAEDPVAMDEGFAPNPYRGAPARRDVPALCGGCHSDPVYMRRFRPDIRVDQEREYWTSHHGQALAAGDERVATCVDCHGAHGIRRPSDPSAPVYPTRVAETCQRCHADAARMAGSKLADGSPLPIDQYAHWRQSVHARALLEKEDLSAPTCNDCHGNHGAAPPGLDSVAFVCGQCHGREAELFRASPKREGFEEHAALLADAGSCDACHQPPEPQAAVTARLSQHAVSECASCHGNHGVVRPTIAMLAPLPETPCALCHEGSGPLAVELPEPEAKRRNYEAVRDGLLAQAATAGLAAEARFDWLVDRAQELPTHVLSGEEGRAAAELRPEFRRLFEKFRIGKTYYTYQDPTTGRPARAAVVRCSDCHGGEPELASEPVGHRTGAAFLAAMQELTGLTARAERMVLEARRGGVETRPALAAIDEAVDAQIELEVLVHGFTAGEGSAFAAKHAAGVASARTAFEEGRSALAELGFRRRGLMVALAFVALVLVALALKIHQLPH